MAAEMPLVTAAIGRCPNDTVQLAAFAIVYAVALLVEAPVIMLLAASTALVRDEQSYRTVAGFTHASGLVLTLLHAALAFTPLFDRALVPLLDAPPDVIEPVRLGLQLVTPWTWAIATRRFEQGILIRHGQGRLVILGTAIRLIAGVAVLGLGLWGNEAGWEIPGIAMGAAALSAGVVAEAVFAHLTARPYAARVRRAPPQVEPLDLGGFLRFYLPLACTPLMTLTLQPIGARAMIGMPSPKQSLAAWSVVYGLIFVTRSVGFALNEVVVAHAREPGALRPLARFAGMLALGAMAVLAAVAFTPLAGAYFVHWSDLADDVVPIAASAVGVGLLMPGYAALQNFYQGVLVAHRKTLHVTEAVLLYFGLAAALIAVGVVWSPWTGVHTVLACFTIAGLAQTAWLAYRSRPLRLALLGDQGTMQP